MSKSEIKSKIIQLKKERRAIMLVHNYQAGEIQEVADHIGDSLGLSRIASQTDAEVIVFCGVHFMAETASILCPDKKVLMPEINAGCPMVDMITAQGLRDLKKKHPKALVVGYVNTSAQVKAEIDICCTSANAIQVVNSLKDTQEIIFVPDKYLADYISRQTNRKLIPWNGYCPTHVKIQVSDIEQAKKAHPQAEVLVHPECQRPVVEMADQVFSTDGMCKYARKSKAQEMIIGTEIGLLYRLRKENPNKKFYPASPKAICPNMKKTNLEKVLWSLEDLKYEVKVAQHIRVRAKKAVDRMLEIL